MSNRFRSIAVALGAAASIAAAAFSAPAAAVVNVFACEPEWGALAQELGGDKVKIYTATTALQDVHHVEARPSLLARARNADLMVCTGADLEVGWLPLLLSQSANPKIQTGQPGHLEASSFVAKLEVPSSVDRSQGDVHPAGNPHIHTDPHNIAKVGEALTARLAQLDVADADFFKARGAAFQDKWRGAMQGWETRAAPLKGVPIVVYHKDLSYLIRWLGMREVGALEPKPGVPPTTGYLSELLGRLKTDPARIIVRSAYADPKAGEWLSERAKVPAIMLPYTVGGSDAAKDLFSLFDDTIARLQGALK